MASVVISVMIENNNAEDGNEIPQNSVIPGLKEFRRSLEERGIQYTVSKTSTASPTGGGYISIMLSRITDFFNQSANPQITDEEEQSVGTVGPTGGGYINQSANPQNTVDFGWSNTVSMYCGSVTIAGLAVRMMLMVGPKPAVTIWDAVVTGTASGGFVFSWNSQRLKEKNSKASQILEKMGSAATSTSVVILSCVFLPTEYIFVPILFGSVNLVLHFVFK